MNKKININGFKSILRSTQDDLHEYLSKQILSLYSKEDCVIDFEYIFAKGKIPILLCCHLDTVHKKLPETIIYDQETNMMWSPEGIGGDDRCGLWAILHILASDPKNMPSVLFTTEEETGSWGAAEASIGLLDHQFDFKMAIELDRRGLDDCVFYRCDNKAFQEKIESYGFVTKIGSRSDICEICPKWNIAGVNLSIGYFSEHTLSETIDINAMMSTVEKVQKILKDHDKLPFYQYQSNKKKVKKYEYDHPELDEADWPLSEKEIDEQIEKMLNSKSSLA